MIEAKNISKKFGDKDILKNVSGVFKTGQTNLIIGASGTGKSVLLKCIVGLELPDVGSVFYDDRDFTTSDTETIKEIRQEIGMLFQSAALFDSKTVEENVMFPLKMLTKQSKEEMLERVNFCLQRVGLENVNKLMPSQLSGGMQKRVGIARAIVLNPKYLFCDEPNSGLDPLTSIKIDGLIKEITQEFNITTVVVTHDMNSVLEIGTNIIFLYKGEKIWEGNKKDIIHSGSEKLDEFVFASKMIRDLKTKL